MIFLAFQAVLCVFIMHVHIKALLFIWISFMRTAVKEMSLVYEMRTLVKVLGAYEGVALCLNVKEPAMKPLLEIHAVPRLVLGILKAACSFSYSKHFKTVALKYLWLVNS